MNMDYYNESVVPVLAELNTPEPGLTDEEVLTRRASFSLNELQTRTDVNPLQIFSASLKVLSSIFSSSQWPSH